MLLTVENLVKEFDGVVANDEIDLEIEQGEIVGLIGPNGAGKTTLFNCIVGYHKPTSGRITFEGKDITNWPAPKTNHAGIARTFQVMRLMGDLTVEENAMVGAFCKIGNRERARELAVDVLKEVGLFEVKDMYPTELPIASQKRIELARALSTQPTMVMLDEIAAGLNPQETEELIGIIRKVHQEANLTLFLTEHVMEFISEIAQRVLVLANGEKIAQGPPQEVLTHPEVIAAYLGEDYAEGE